MNGDAVNMYPGACAACKYQRKRCDANCRLARYFPGSKYEDFQNVHRLFGVNNILKILNAVPSNLKDKTAETLILEAKIRKKHPVHGSRIVEANLRAQIDTCQKELDFVRKQLSFYDETKKMLEQKGQLIHGLSESLLPHSLEPNSELSQSQFASMPLISQPFPPSQQQFGTSFDDCYHQALTAVGPPSDTNFNGYNYQSTLEEGEEIIPFDIQPMDEVMD